jgi:hypothetical protein
LEWTLIVGSVTPAVDELGGAESVQQFPNFPLFNFIEEKKNTVFIYVSMCLLRVTVIIKGLKKRRRTLRKQE